MFGFHTPVKNFEKMDTLAQEVGPTQTSKVRRSIGEWEAGKSSPIISSRMTVEAPEASSIIKNRTPQTQKYANKTSEARACLMSAKKQLGEARNLRGDIKSGVTRAVERLFYLVKEAEKEKEGGNINKGEKQKNDEVRKEAKQGNVKDIGQEQSNTQEKERKRENEEIELIKNMQEHGMLLKENKEEMKKLKEMLRKQLQMIEESGTTYASVVAGLPRRASIEATAMHSVVITSKDENQTGEQVLDQIRKAVNAKEEGVKIDKVRKARDRKVIVGCRSQEEIGKVKERIEKAGGQLQMAEIENKDPLIILLGVLQSHTDEDILGALRTQNRNLLRGVSGSEDRMEVKFRKRARNPHTAHVILKVSPIIWARLTEAGAVYVDIQRVRVADQTPLVQCSRCLGYGHGKRLCQETVDVCSHCGGPHLKTECENWTTQTTPTCCNCHRAKMESTDHNAFSSDCPIRKKWDAIARSTVAYC